MVRKRERKSPRHTRAAACAAILLACAASASAADVEPNDTLATASLVTLEQGMFSGSIAGPAIAVAGFDTGGVRLLDFCPEFYAFCGDIGPGELRLRITGLPDDPTADPDFQFPGNHPQSGPYDLLVEFEGPGSIVLESISLSGQITANDVIESPLTAPANTVGVYAESEALTAGADRIDYLALQLPAGNYTVQVESPNMRLLVESYGGDGSFLEDAESPSVFPPYSVELAGFVPAQGPHAGTLRLAVTHPDDFFVSGEHWSAGDYTIRVQDVGTAVSALPSPPLLAALSLLLLTTGCVRSRRSARARKPRGSSEQPLGHGQDVVGLE